ncbi:hypothetical protein OG241_07765 [Streptomyces sp. NBC_01390]|uniref:hypothetical protein n=1 Tax=Streptomyces sp. NBC_01390 TaxID=2903850 RepID=UPI00324C495E
MSSRLEFVRVASGQPVDLLYPGTSINGDLVGDGEMAVALWNRGNGIALHGTQQDLLDRLEQLSAVVRAAPPLPTEPYHLPAHLDPDDVIPETGDVCVDHVHDTTRCATPGITVRDPRRATCAACLSDWNDTWHTAIATVLYVPADPTDHTISPSLPYSLTGWVTDDSDSGKASRITAKQRQALQLIHDNPGRVVVRQRGPHTAGYLNVHNSTARILNDCGLICRGYATGISARPKSGRNDDKVYTWALTRAGLHTLNSQPEPHIEEAGHDL